MISARNIHKRYGDLDVLKGIDLDIEPGRVTTIVGPSGAGKTTLLLILGTLLAPESGGSLRYGDTDLLTLSDARLSAYRNRNIGFVFQAHRLLPEFSLVENVAMPALIAGRGRGEAFDEARRLLDSLGLGSREQHRPAELSGGECQRAAVARALINRPQVVFADEPSGSLDSHNRAELHSLFFRLRDELGATFVIVTHDDSLAADSDIKIRMADGRIASID
ncbi:MAG: ABC transporter ATP-binding protein [Bacteroidales bacterium]|nr:ABC transporter ATP-binding protein [Bacteroidales bacterium]MBD5215024.1 ABC transporter ATP-binding protein [Bacteroidales bacterium]MBD5219859.1 ABC transporter ATP-binding protein [Bacteroidales bacterium]MDE6436485.1 ABC transporter ATP-binding protein [Muribaculaceae bacterium]